MGHCPFSVVLLSKVIGPKVGVRFVNSDYMRQVLFLIISSNDVNRPVFFGPAVAERTTYGVYRLVIEEVL
jgi:hypothetical protein